MNLREIETALDLHQRAFAFLLDCGTKGHAGAAQFDEATLAAWWNAVSCAAWLTRHLDQLPISIRPSTEDVPAFAHYLSSLFATSFSAQRIRRDGAVRLQVRALPTRRLDGSRKSLRSAAREQANAHLLRQHALESLATESGESFRADAIQTMLGDPAVAEDLTLWTYAVQLVNRAHFASQGSAVYRLWLDLPEKTRRNLTADRIWKSRGRLQQHLQSFQLTHSQ